MAGWKRQGIVFLTALILLSTLSLPAYCQELETTAQSALLLDAHSGAVLFEKEPHVPRPPPA